MAVDPAALLDLVRNCSSPEGEEGEKVRVPVHDWRRPEWRQEREALPGNDRGERLSLKFNLLVERMSTIKFDLVY